MIGRPQETSKSEHRSRELSIRWQLLGRCCDDPEKGLGEIIRRFYGDPVEDLRKTEGRSLEYLREILGNPTEDLNQESLATVVFG